MLRSVSQYLESSGTEFDSADNEINDGAELSEPQKRLKKLAEEILKDSVDSLLQYLQAFEEEIKLLEGQDYPTLPFALLSYRRLMDESDSEATDSVMVQRVKERAKEELLKRVHLDDLHKLATFLCPQFRKLSVLEEDERNRIWDLARSRCEAMEPATCQETLEPPSKRPRLSGIGHFTKYSDSVPKETVRDEVTRYLSDSFDEVDEHGILQFWKNATAYPKLRRLARKTLVIYSTSSASERNFSTAGHMYMYSPRRACLDPDTVDDSLFYCSYLRNINKKK